MYSFHRLSTILQVEYGGIDMMQDPMENFNHCARCYATNKGKSRTTAGRQLLIRMYVWALQQYGGGEVHWIHRHLISLSFFWATFAKGIVGRRRQNEKEHVSPRMTNRDAESALDGCMIQRRSSRAWPQVRQPQMNSGTL